MGQIPNVSIPDVLHPSEAAAFFEHPDNVTIAKKRVDR